MFECIFNKYTFWIGFIIGGIIFTAISELLQLALGVKSLTKELKRKNDINERNERIEPKL